MQPEIMAAESSGLSDRAEHYRQLAAELRVRAASMKTAVARRALASAAEAYELLALHVQSLISTWQTLQRRPDE